MQSLKLGSARKAFRFFVVALSAVILSPLVSADTYRSGQHIEPAFEGWRPNEDGTFNMMFGYMNEN